MKKLTTKDFIQRAKNKHGDKYNYSRVYYSGINEKVEIFCYKHGWFFQTPSKHLKGLGCSKCGYEHQAKQTRFTTKMFICKSKKIHGKKYDYSKSEYINAKKKILIIYPNHGEFYQKAHDHMTGSTCLECAKEKMRSNKHEFLKKIKKIHFNKYDYSKVDYIRNFEKIIVTCKKHGDFLITPANHLRGKGCPKCKSSEGENIIRFFLEKNRIIFEEQKAFNYCKVKKNLLFDFFIPEKNILIEMNGIQHYNFKKYFHKKKDDFDDQKIRDHIKRCYAIVKNIKLIEIPYWEKNNIESILIKEIGLNVKNGC